MVDVVYTAMVIFGLSLWAFSAYYWLIRRKGRQETKASWQRNKKRIILLYASAIVLGALTGTIVGITNVTITEDDMRAFMAYTFLGAVALCVLVLIPLKLWAGRRERE